MAIKRWLLLSVVSSIAYAKPVHCWQQTVLTLHHAWLCKILIYFAICVVGQMGISMQVALYSIHTRTRLAALFPGLPRWAGTRKVKPIWILLKQETVSGSGISWAICKSSPCSRQITMPAAHHSVFYRPDALPAAQPTASKHWIHNSIIHSGVLGGIRGYTAYTNLRGFLTAYTHLSDHK